MKLLKITSIALLFLIVSCSKSDDDNVSASSINPPDWIIGTWMNSFDIGGFRFSEDDVILVTTSSETSWKELVKIGENTPSEFVVEESSFDSSYNVSFTTSGVTTFYEFTKISESVIEYGSGVLATELFKQ